MAVAPDDPDRVWYAVTTWGEGAEGGVYETNNGGDSWSEITGNLPYCKPLLLRFNPEKRKLWAAGACIVTCRR